MRISDWSSDVCSSDLGADVGAAGAVNIAHRRATAGLALAIGPAFGPTPHRVEDVEQIPALRGQPIFVTRRPLPIGLALDHALGHQPLEPRRDKLRAKAATPRERLEASPPEEQLAQDQQPRADGEQFGGAADGAESIRQIRSEEHTSELQSLM